MYETLAIGFSGVIFLLVRIGKNSEYPCEILHANDDAEKIRAITNNMSLIAASDSIVNA
jgi:hypothetical protein